jgi:hypothetical protein
VLDYHLHPPAHPTTDILSFSTALFYSTSLTFIFHFHCSHNLIFLKILTAKMNSGHILLIILVVWVLTALLGDLTEKK